MRTLKYFQHSWLAFFFLLLLMTQIFREYNLAGLRSFPETAAVLGNLFSEFFPAVSKDPV